MRNQGIRICLACGFLLAWSCQTSDGNTPADDAHGEADQTHAVHWGYDGEDGPDLWADLSADWALCAGGSAQSPIDISEQATVSTTDTLALNLPTADVRVIRQEHVLEALDNGHTIQVNVDAGDTLTLGDSTFDLVQYHFHAPSEHTVDGDHYPMEMHLVHSSESGELAVVGVFIEEGEHNAAFDAVWSNMPTEVGDQVVIEHVSVNIDDMLPTETIAWRYQGSLTTPPCSEDVRWIVMQKPVELDAAQIQQFRDVFTGNNRPTQPLNGRVVASDTPVVH